MGKAARKLDYDSTLGELYRSPVGHDALARVLLQLGLPERALTNRAVSGLKLRTVAKLAGKKLGAGFFDALLELVNGEKDQPCSAKGRVTPKWWKEAVFYQIYPRSFCDSNGDGIGDLQGIIGKLDYLRELGVDALWLSPIYDSPNDDNGYDIRDYDKIMEEFGTMEDFMQLLDQVHRRGMRLIMDLVVNHTSDEHIWYRQALQPGSPYREYYFFREDDGSRRPPNNWTSFFSGPAWKYEEETDSWALHLFSQKQMDLNWDNPKVREEIIAMVNRWLERGVDGFRMDVINYISKREGLPQGDETIGGLMGYYGIEHYYYGPRLHQYLREIRERAFAPHGAFSVGETPGLGMKMCQLVTGEERGELDMVFSFDHLETPGHVRFQDYAYDLNYFRDYMIDWMEHYGSNCWMSLFYNNHDNPRMISKITKDASWHTALSKLLAVMQLTLKGTPFIYQGQEIGMVNFDFDRMRQLNDVESKNVERVLRRFHVPQRLRWKIIRRTSRDNARTPFQWNEEKGAGFTDGRPWLGINRNSEQINLSRQEKDPESIWQWYKDLSRLRRDSAVLRQGEFVPLEVGEQVFAYRRVLGDEALTVVLNFSEKEAVVSHRGEVIRSNVGRERFDGRLGAWEAAILG